MTIFVEKLKFVFKSWHFGKHLKIYILLRLYLFAFNKQVNYKNKVNFFHFFTDPNAVFVM